MNATADGKFIKETPGTGELPRLECTSGGKEATENPSSIVTR